MPYGWGWRQDRIYVAIGAQPSHENCYGINIFYCEQIQGCATEHVIWWRWCKWSKNTRKVHAINTRKVHSVELSVKKTTVWTAMKKLYKNGKKCYIDLINSNLFVIYVYFRIADVVLSLKHRDVVCANIQNADLSSYSMEMTWCNKYFTSKMTDWVEIDRIRKMSNSF